MQQICRQFLELYSICYKTLLKKQGEQLLETRNKILITVKYNNKMVCIVL